MFQRKVVNRQIYRAIKESMPHSLPDQEFRWARKDKMVKVLHCGGEASHNIVQHFIEEFEKCLNKGILDESLSNLDA